MVEQELFAAILEHSPDAILFIDSAGRIRYWTRSTERLLGISAAEIAGSSSLFHLLNIEPESAAPVGSSAADSNSTEASAEFQRSAFSCSLDHPVWGQITATPLVIAGRSWQMVVLKNATADDARYRELERQAYTDSLSELLNRRGFQQALESNLNRPLSLAIIDVDFFKRINDRFGHRSGDEAIQWIAQKIRESFPQSLGIGRLGGDEFGVVLDCHDIVEARNIFQSFCQTIEQDRSAGPWEMTISIGVAVAKAPVTSPRELLSSADQAMYRSKLEGRNQVTVVEVDPIT